MNFHVLTLFPDMILQGTGTSVTGRAVRNHVIGLDAVNIRDFSEDKHRRVDDYTYGGGAGMLMQPQPVFDAWNHVRRTIPEGKKIRTVYVTPQGLSFSQNMAEELAQEDELIFLCGHYEGIDERVLEEIVTDYVSIGDYVLTGGELAAMVMIDAIARLVPGVLHNDVSSDTESFHGNLLEYPQYTRPEEWHGKRVPAELLSGDPKDAAQWRMSRSIARTKERRPDLYLRYQAALTCRKMLMTEKISNMDMISSIDQGHYEILSDQQGYLLKNPLTGTYYFSDFVKGSQTADEEEGKGEALWERIHELIQSARNDPAGRGHAFYFRAKNFSASDPFFKEDSEELRLMVLTRREKLAVTGLYRPDGKETAKGIRILPVVIPQEEANRDDPVFKEEFAKVIELFKKAGADEERALELIRRGKAYCLYINGLPAGTAGERQEGFADYIYAEDTEEAGLCRKALLTYVSNSLLEQGKVPYLYLDNDREELFETAVSLGFYQSRVPVYRLVL